MATLKKFDRGMNPNDGSRRRLKSEEHKTEKDYKKISKSEIHKLLEDLEIGEKEFLNNKNE